MNIHQCDDSIFVINPFDIYFLWFLVWPMYRLIEGEGFIDFSVASHQRAIKMFWSHFWLAVHFYVLSMLCTETLGPARPPKA